MDLLEFGVVFCFGVPALFPSYAGSDVEWVEVSTYKGVYFGSIAENPEECFFTRSLSFISAHAHGRCG